MEVFLVRHTKPDVPSNLIYGRYDVPLASSYTEEREAILPNLPSDPDVVFSSPSSRCSKLAYSYSDKIIQDERLYEMNFGAWEAQTWDGIDRNESELWMRDFVNRCPPQGEKLSEMNCRVMDFWKSLLSMNYHKAVVFTHAGVIRLILANHEGIPISSMFDNKVEYGQVILLKV